MHIAACSVFVISKNIGFSILTKQIFYKQNEKSYMVSHYSSMFLIKIQF